MTKSDWWDRNRNGNIIPRGLQPSLYNLILLFFPLQLNIVNLVVETKEESWIIDLIRNTYFVLNCNKLLIFVCIF